ncbi:MAG TPA: BadF/BadG/BcrA/BcrD ATPase family protein [Deinococcales bacterium]|nr:BadF/BadG/BcrA/BcrD ATPase family protein [Deinococcales bacterium]
MAETFLRGAIGAGLGIDAGGSGTEWLLLGADGTRLGQGRVAGITGHLFSAAGTVTAEGHLSLERLGQLLQSARAAGEMQAVVLGAAGLSPRSPAAEYFAAFIQERLGLHERQVRVVHDLHIAYRANFRPGEGALVYGGTGSIAYHLKEHGGELRVGGHGYLIDDAGSGYAIGRAALACVLRWHDELGQPADNALAEEVYRQLGTSSWPEIREIIYRGGRSRVAALVPAVKAALAHCDEAAAQIVGEAGAELARLGRVTLKRAGKPLPVALAGGVTNLGKPLQAAFRAGLPDIEVRTSNREPVEGAARLALEFSNESS